MNRSKKNVQRYGCLLLCIFCFVRCCRFLQPPRKQIQKASGLNDEEEWLEQHGSIRIGWLNHDPGISEFDGESGEMLSVLDDYVKAATDCFGNQTLDFDLVGFDTQEEQLQALKDGEIDMIFHFSQHPDAAGQHILCSKSGRYGFAVNPEQDAENHVFWQ